MSTPADPESRRTLPGAVGILLAAGAGRRMGRPKALVVGDDGEPWLVRGVRVLREGGCADVVVVLGAEAARARALLAGDPDVVVVEAADWHEGIGASLRAALTDLSRAQRRTGPAEPAGARRHPSATDFTGAPTDVPAFAVVTLVDLPELPPEAIRRVAAETAETTLRQASYAGRPGHPVVIGAAHFAALAATLEGDVGARPYLRAHGVEAVDCTDLGGGDDVDAPPLRAG
jgi:CTP:molybdopterin cytidylyltransferase MocA